jgi:hypothetical protein
MHWRGNVRATDHDARSARTHRGAAPRDGHIGGNGANKHFHLSTLWRPFAAWVFRELGWLAATIVFLDNSQENRERPVPAQQYKIRTHAHPALTRLRSWYDESGTRRLPAPEDLPAGRLTPRAGRAWHATAGSLGWSNPDYATTRQAYFSAEADDRADRVKTLFESAGFEPTRADKGVQLPPTQTSAWLDWVGSPVEGVEYKWADSPNEYRKTKRAVEALRARLWFQPKMEPLPDL